MERPRLRSSRALFPAAVAASVLAPLAVHWVTGRTLVWFDTQMLYAPQRWIVDEALRAFRLPLWNPYMGAGMPFLADAIHGVLHPVSILAAWLPTDRKLDVLIGGYVLCAGLGAALLARELGASRAGAAVAAVAFGTSGYVLSMAGNLVFLAGAGTLPFCVVGLRRAARDPSPSSVALAVAGVAALALSGDPQALIVGGALGLALALEVAGWRGAVRSAAAGTAGLLVAAVQLVPTAAHIERTVRAAGRWTPTPSVWPLEPWRLPELVLPGLLRGSDPMLDRVFEALAGPGHWPEGLNPYPFAASICVGLLPVVLAIAGAREGRRGAVLAALALVLVWVAMGPRLGAEAVLGHVPIWSAFRYSEKLVGPLTLVLAALAALGVDAVVERRVSGRAVATAAAAVALASIAVFALTASRLPPRVAAEAQARVLRGAWHLLGAGGALAAWFVARRRLGIVGARNTLAVLAWGSVAAASPMALRPGAPAARLRSPGPALDAPAPGPRIVTPFTRDPIVTGPGLDWCDQAGRDHAALAFPAYNVRFRLDSLAEYEAMTPSRLALLQAAFGPRWPEAQRRFGATHVLVPSPVTHAQQEWRDAAIRGATLARTVPAGGIWTVPHREWASFAQEVRVVGEEHAAVLETVGAFIEGSDAVVVEASTRFDAGPGRVLAIDRGLESLRIEAEAPAATTLVVADAWWPGWEATLDGWSLPIFPADGLVRAVRWPAGRHVLEMRYRPPEVRTGILLSVLGLVLAASWVGAGRWRRARLGR